MIYIDDLIGIPYKRNGRDIRGYDCYGLAIEVEKRFGHILPDLLEAKAEHYVFSDCRNICLKMIDGIFKINTPQKEGDILLFEDSNGIMFHIGVYLGNNRFIHCNKAGVHIANINKYKISEVFTWL